MHAVGVAVLTAAFLKTKTPKNVFSISFPSTLKVIFLSIQEKKMY